MSAQELYPALKSILLGMLALALGDAVIKVISAEINIWQLFFYRGVMTLPVLMFILHKAGISLSLRVEFWVHLRSLFFMLAGCIFLGALSVLDFALAAVIFFLAPIFTSLFTAFILKIPVSKRQWLSLIFGFLGVIISINPLGTEFHIMIILPLLAAVFYALSMVLTHEFCADIPPVQLVYLLHIYYFGGACIMLALLFIWSFPPSWISANAFLFGEAQPFNPSLWGWIALQAFLAVLAFWGISRAYQSKSPQVIALFEYSYLIFAPILGLFLFQEPITSTNLIGIALIIFAGALSIKSQSAISDSS